MDLNETIGNKIREGLTDEEINQLSEIETVKEPSYNSNVPAHLLKGKSESETWLYNQISILSQQNEFQLYMLKRSRKFHVTNQLEIFDLRRRLRVLEEWRDRLVSKWSLIAAIGVVMIPTITMIFWEILKPHLGFK